MLDPSPSSSPLRLTADADIPLVLRAFARYGPVEVLPGRELTRDVAARTDVLLVRSVTRVGAPLLKETPVGFVGTATAGTDHVDTDWLAAHGVAFADAPGSNATSVVEWVLAALTALAVGQGGGLRGKTLGVVGGGHVGGRLAPRAAALGLRVLVCDPPLARAAEAAGHPHAYVPYAHVLEEADVVTFHTPLTRPGERPDPTYHLLDARALARLRRGAWVLNASRGAVVDRQALLAALETGHVAAAALDVWEGEPVPDTALAERVQIATPHVAGYGYDAK
ncbi:MAG TPA: 4-phosphoerythronate dehydrogenase, partial [Rhodothermales bacterium]|nr:4-phosphoerythronate dehydrogenase [Rhodothermales bacterium]